MLIRVVGEDITIEQFSQNLLRAINGNELSSITALKRIFNDFREYNERGQRFNQEQIRTRLNEIADALPRVQSTVAALQATGRDTTNLKRALHQVENVIQRLKSLSPSEQPTYLLSDKTYEAFRGGETALTRLDGLVCAMRLNPSTKEFIKGIADYSLMLFVKYLRERDRMSHQNFKLELQKMGLRNDVGMNRIIQISENIYDIPRDILVEEIEGLKNKRNATELFSIESSSADRSRITANGRDRVNVDFGQARVCRALFK